MNERGVMHFRAVPVGPDTVYIGRPGPWGNPFVIGESGTRDDVLNLFESWLWAKNYGHNRPLGEREQALVKAFKWMREHIHELEGKTLLCWCAPMPCHGDILVRYLKEQCNDE